MTREAPVQVLTSTHDVRQVQQPMEQFVAIVQDVSTHVPTMAELRYARPASVSVSANTNAALTIIFAPPVPVTYAAPAVTAALVYAAPATYTAPVSAATAAPIYAASPTPYAARGPTTLIAQPSAISKGSAYTGKGRGSATIGQPPMGLPTTPPRDCNTTLEEGRQMGLATRATLVVGTQGNSPSAEGRGTTDVPTHSSHRSHALGIFSVACILAKVC